MRREKCPDCGVVLQPHAFGCMTKAVEDGQLTPRQRQVAIVERQMALGIHEVPIDASITSSFEQAFRIAARVAGADDRVVHANAGDISRLAAELGIYRPGPDAASPKSPLMIEGINVVQDPLAPEGTLLAYPRKVHDLVSAAPEMNVQVGYDPAFSNPISYSAPVFSVKGADGRFGRIAGLSL